MNDVAHASVERVRPETQEPVPRVMIADDNPDHVAMTAALLHTEGFDVRGLPSGTTLLEQFTAFRPHVVILDIGMPVLTGYDVARSLRASSEGAVVLLIALTGYDTQGDRWLSRRSGFDHHLAKPVDPNTLTAIIRDYLAGNPPVA